MRVTVFTFATDDDSGTESQAFGSEYARDAAAWDWCRDRCDFEDLDEDEVKRKYPEWVDLYKKINDSFSTCSTDQHTIEVPNVMDTIDLQWTWASEVAVLAAVLSNPASETGRRATLAEVQRMAQVADVALKAVQMLKQVTLGEVSHDEITEFLETTK